MKSKFAKRLSAVVLSLAMCVGLLCTSALAAGTVNEVKEKTGSNGSIVVTVYDQEPGSAGTGAQISSGLSNPVEGVGINALRIGSVVELTSTDDNGTVSTQVAFRLTETYTNLLGLSTTSAIASQNSTYYFEPTDVQDALKNANQTTIEGHLESASGKKNDVTENDGIARFDGLDYGLYLLAKSSLPADATTDLVPFLVSVPMYVESESGDAWQSTVYAYPKVRTADITISKTVDDQDGKGYTTDNDKYVNAGQTLKYTVTITIPAAATSTGTANEFTNFVIADTNAGSTLDIDEGTVKVKLGETELTSATDYTVGYPGAGSDSVLTITLIEAGLTKINTNMGTAKTITVTYNATVATDVTFSTKLTNTAKATYQREGMNGTADATVADGQTNTVDLYTYGIDLTKTLSDGGDNIDQDTIIFALYSDQNCTTQIPVVAGTGTTSCYWIAASGSSSATMYVDTDGRLNLYGLEPGTYYLKETATMDGYTLLAEPITIVITAADDQQGGDPTATATVNGANAQVADGVVSLSVENTKNDTGFTLPQTGGAGTLLATAIGLGLLCVAVILLVIYRKKGR